MKAIRYMLAGVLILVLSCNQEAEEPISVSGIYPHLAMYNEEDECGTGAVVPWAGNLWVITYGPHLPNGSSDKLYEITPGLEQIIRPGSIGGTPANRMIHNESNQLFIGPYAVDADRNVRVIPYDIMPGRHTGNARHLFDPAGKLYYGTMEEGFYEVNAMTLAVKELYRDGNIKRENKEHQGMVNPPNATLPGAHGKGLYSGQGVLVYSNNGEATPEALEKFDVDAGVLAEWDGYDWKVVRRNQFVEVTGPGGISGNRKPETDPVWATGWDHKSVILGVRDSLNGWSFFRLPKASHSYDGAHGWNTEWPRIRNVGDAEKDDYLMTMHGMFWRFPGTFAAGQTAGVRPRSAYLKVIGDFARWNNKLVFGCDDSARKEFLNKRKQKGNIEGPGQSNSNLWFTSSDKPDQLGPETATGSVWINEEIEAGEYSEPFLFAGWPHRCAWISNHGNKDAQFIFEVDARGDQKWSELMIQNLQAGESRFVAFNENQQGEWIRAMVSESAVATLTFSYTASEDRSNSYSEIFKGLSFAGDQSSSGGLLYALGDNRKTLGVAVVNYEGGNLVKKGYYELDEKLNLVPKDDAVTEAFIQEKFAIPGNVVKVEESSVLIEDDRGRRWRLPLGDEHFKELHEAAQLRVCREVATERDLFNCSGTFYELPAENADGFAKIRPVASHNFRIHDYASYRGMLVMTGIDPKADVNGHLIRSSDGNAAVWVGAVDDLWEMGKPAGKGGPWNNTAVNAGVPSDPYLIGFYDNRLMHIEHDAAVPVTFRIEVDPTGQGTWMLYREESVGPGRAFEHLFPENFQARWIRFVTDKDCKATTFLKYN